MRATIPLLSILVMMAPATVAGHCETYATSFPEVETPASPLGVHYVDYDHCPHEGCVTAVWVYEESNGIAGLQRGDETIDDTCHGSIRSDTIIF